MHAAAVLRGVVPVPTRRVAGGVETSLHATAGCGFSRPASWRVRQTRHTGGSRGPSRFRVTRNRASTENDPTGDNTQTGKEEELDFITRMVVKVFGAGVMSDPEPMGLKRMSKSEWPDQWPALCDGSVAQLLPEDDTKELQTIRAVLAQTQLENMPLGIAYDANVHGWKASSFHTQCDGQGAAILICESTNGLLFGGYNPKGWLGYGEWLDAISAFLWVYPAGAGKCSPVKLGKTGGSGMAIIDDDGKGPKWGPDGLAIDLENQTARSRLGSYYERTPQNGKSLFGAGGAVEIKSCRIYVALGDSQLAKSYEPNMFQWKKGELEGIRRNDFGNTEGEGDEDEKPKSENDGFKMPKMPWDNGN